MADGGNLSFLLESEKILRFRQINRLLIPNSDGARALEARAKPG